jgi:hypothetical protein
MMVSERAISRRPQKVLRDAFTFGLAFGRLLTRTTVDHAVWASEMIIDPELGIGRQTLTRSASSWRTSSALAQGFRQQKREGYVPRSTYWAFNDSNDMGFTR